MRRIANLVLRLRRLKELSSLVSLESPDVPPLKGWLGGLLQPGAFLSATRQWSARTQSLPLEKLKLEVTVADNSSAVSGTSGSQFFITVRTHIPVSQPAAVCFGH